MTSVYHNALNIWAKMYQIVAPKSTMERKYIIFNYHSSGSSMYKYLTFITCSMIYQHRYSYA